MQPLPQQQLSNSQPSPYGTVGFVCIGVWVEKTACKGTNNNSCYHGRHKIPVPRQTLMRFSVMDREDAWPPLTSSIFVWKSQSCTAGLSHSFYYSVISNRPRDKPFVSLEQTVLTGQDWLILSNCVWVLEAALKLGARHTKQIIMSSEQKKPSSSSIQEAMASLTVDPDITAEMKHSTEGNKKAATAAAAFQFSTSSVPLCPYFGEWGHTRS